MGAGPPDDELVPLAPVPFDAPPPLPPHATNEATAGITITAPKIHVFIIDLREGIRCRCAVP